MSRMKSPFMAAYFTDDEKFIAACHASTARGNKNHDGYAPYPMHALLNALGLKRSLLGRPVLFMLLFCAFCGFMMQYYTMHVDWPIIIAGKPFNSWPAYVVITFEMGVLAGAISNMLLVLFVFNKLMPNPNTKVLKERLTDDTYCLVIPLKDNGSEEELRTFLEEQDADEIELIGEGGLSRA